MFLVITILVTILTFHVIDRYMKTTFGITHNIDKTILGKITTEEKRIFGRKDYILVKKNISAGTYGYLAVITNVESVNGDKPIVSGVQNLDEFHSGDVVSITKEGEISFLYERNAKHNAVYVTDLCNHRCIMCPQPPISQEEDKTPFNLKLISLLDKDIKEIGITGGEPTMIGDRLFDIIRQIKKYTPKASITLLSNGVKFANKDYAMKLAMCHHHDLQIDIPIFSDIPEEHNKIVGAKTFYKTVQGLYNLALFGQMIGIRIVVHKLTYKRLPQMADYIYHNFPFVSHVAFMQMETTGMAQEHIDKLWIDPYDYNKELDQAISILDQRDISTHIYNAQLCVLPPALREFSVNSISDWKDAYLDKCTDCQLKNECGGLFASNMDYHSTHISPVIYNKPNI